MDTEPARHYLIEAPVGNEHEQDRNGPPSVQDRLVGERGGAGGRLGSGRELSGRFESLMLEHRRCLTKRLGASSRHNELLVQQHRGEGSDEGHVVAESECSAGAALGDQFADCPRIEDARRSR